jgi:hypothetical protein
MELFDDAHDALDWYETDDTQWMLVETLTDTPRYAVGPEMDALHMLLTGGWEMTSPEELARAIRQA